MMDAGYFQEISGWSPKEATSRLLPRSGGTRPKAPGGICDAQVKEYLREVIARCERLADESRNHPSRTDKGSQRHDQPPTVLKH
jgi:hypothetical protein